MQTILRDDANIQKHIPVILHRIARWHNSLDIAIQGTKRNLNNASSLMTTAQTYAGFLSVVDPTSPELCRAIRLGARAAGVLFEAASTSASHLAINLDESGEVDVNLADFTGVGASVNTWLLGYFMAVICDDNPAQDSLMRTPVEVLRRSPAILSEYAFMYADMIQRTQRKQTWGQQLKAVLDATDPARLEDWEVDFVSHVRVPEIDLWWRLGERDAVVFNARLAEALNVYRRFTQIAYREEPDQMHPNLYIAWGPLALCCMAQRLGFSIEVRSDYIPAHIVAGECIVNPEQAQPVAYVLLCPYCRGEIADDTGLCPHCGLNTRRDAVLQESTRRYADLPRTACAFCGRTVIADAIFCPFCRNLRRPDALLPGTDIEALKTE